MWFHLPLRGMMVTMFDGCEANTILVLLTISMPLSPNTQVAFLNGHYKAIFVSIKLLFYWLILTLQRKISLSIVACIIELMVVVWNACLLTRHTCNWMMVRQTMILQLRSNWWGWHYQHRRAYGHGWRYTRTMLMCWKVHPPPWIKP